MAKRNPLSNTRSGGPIWTPSLSALLAFERAASNLSFVQAARDLGLTPSAVSHRIRGLEQKFGARLFTRAGRAIRLTPAGEEYLRTIKGALDLLEQGSKDLRQHGAGIPEIRISALPFFTSTVIMPALEDFRRRFPNVTLRVDATNQYADFDRGGIDAAIRYGRAQSMGLRFEPLMDIGIACVCAPEIARKLRSPADIVSHPLIHLTVQPMTWDLWLEEAGIGEKPATADLWFDNVLSALDAAERGHGVALAMYPLIKSRKGFGRTLVMPFDKPLLKGEKFYFVYRSEEARSRRILSLKCWLAQAARQSVRT